MISGETVVEWGDVWNYFVSLSKTYVRTEENAKDWEKLMKRVIGWYVSQTRSVNMMYPTDVDLPEVTDAKLEEAVKWSNKRGVIIRIPHGANYDVINALKMLYLIFMYVYNGRDGLTVRWHDNH